MNDIKKKLDVLASQLGMVPAKTLSDPEKKDRKTVARVERTGKTSPDMSPLKATGLLSGELAAQLRARMGLGGDLQASPHGCADDGDPVEIDSLLPGEIVGEEADGFFLYKQTFSLDYCIGNVPLGAGMACEGRQVALTACDAQLQTFDPCNTCYVDTETTGLAGGAGTLAFLFGMGYFAKDAFVLEQCFLRDYDDEGPMLAYLFDALSKFAAVVSYNGKSFDLPLLRARFVQHRLPFPLAETAHYDLVHAARRVWKKRLNDCSLNNIERYILGFQRHEDVPGYLIPQLWLDYLDTRDARPLKNVFHHHEMDILSLAALAGHLSQRLAATDGPAFHHAEDQLSVIRLYYKNKEYASVVEHAQKFLDTSRVTDTLRRDCLDLLARAARRLGDFEEMAAAWQTLHEEYPEDSAGAAELAKYLEHQVRDWEAAARVCRETLQTLGINTDAKEVTGNFSISALRGRLKRLESKIERQQKRQRERGEDIFDT